MATNLLTDKALRAEITKAQAKSVAKNTRIKIRDGNNLMLIVRQTGGASWVLEYRKRGEEKKPYTLGKWPDMSLALARVAATQAREKLAAGIDLNQNKKDLRVAEVLKVAGEKDSVRELFNDFMGKQKCSDIYRKNINAAFIANVLPAIGAMKPHEVKRGDIIAILRAIEARGADVMIRRVRMWLRHVFEFGAGDEKRPELIDMVVPIGHLRTFIPVDYNPFPAVTDPKEAGDLMVAINKFGPYVTRTYLTFAAHLFQRPSELREATWDEFDLDDNIWIIPKERMKKDREHWVPLSPIVVGMLKKHQGVVGNDGYLFPGRSINKPIVQETAEKAIHAIGFQGRHCPHGFRAMARTIGEERLLIDEKFLEKQLSHEEQNKVKKAYNRAQFWLDRVAMMQTWSKWILDATAQSVARSTK